MGGDGDVFLDNCETGRASITVENNGAVPLTNVRIATVTPLTHPGTIITTPLPLRHRRLAGAPAPPPAARSTSCRTG